MLNKLFFSFLLKSTEFLVISSVILNQIYKSDYDLQFASDNSSHRINFLKLLLNPIFVNKFLLNYKIVIWIIKETQTGDFFEKRHT